MSGGASDLAERVGKLKLTPQINFPQKVAPGSRSESCLNVTTNIWGVFPKKNIPVYRYDFRVLEEYPPKGEGKEPAFKEVTKQTREDFISIDRKNKCVAVFRHLLEKEKKFFGDITSFVYDRASILYSMDQLKIGPDEEKTFCIDKKALPSELFNEDCVKVHVKIQRCSDCFQLTTFDLKAGVNSNPELIDRSVQQFYELLLSQEAFFIEGRFVCYGSGESYLLEPHKFGFGENEMPSLPDGKYIGVGVSKAAKILEGPRNTLTMSVYSDVKKAAFHIDYQKLSEKVAMICGSREGFVAEQDIKVLNKMLKGLYVRCDYGKNRTFVVTKVTNETAEKLRLKQQNINLVQYFKTTYNITLKFPKLPLVVEKTSRGLNYYPMELLLICENQRVTLSQQSAVQVQQMIRACATPPAYRLRQTMNMVRALQLHNTGRENRWCKEFQIEVSQNPVQLQARVLQRPQVIYADGHVAPMKESTAWTVPNVRYLFPASCKGWFAIALVSPSDRFGDHDLRKYLDCFLKRCQQRGMIIHEPLVKNCLFKAREEDLEYHFKQAHKMGASFIHFISSENLKFHDRMKYLESQYQVLTQDLKTRTAASVPFKSQTLDNIVHKTNLKLGGLNFELRLESPKLQSWVTRGDRLIIGIDLSFTAAPKKKDTKNQLPSVIGYASNCMKHPLDFIGGYRYCWSEREELSESDNSIQELVTESLLLVKKYRQPAAHIIVLRDGISEGQFKYVVEREVEQIKRGCIAAGGEKYRPHITVLVATKQHNLRIYRERMNERSRPAEQNIPPGTVIDQKIVNPRLNEFYLNSHTALQGTAKTPKYNLLFDTSKMTADEMQGVVYAMTFNLQIVSQACSLPAPIMIAGQMASRGSNNFHAGYDDTASEGVEYDLDHLNSELGYMGKPLASCRFNA